MQRLFSLFPRRAVRKNSRRRIHWILWNKRNSDYISEKNLLSASSFSRASWVSPWTIWPLRLEADLRWRHQAILSTPSISEIKLKLGKASNTAPGEYGLENRHIRSLDGIGELLATIYRAVWSLGIPACWETSRAVPIFNKEGHSHTEQWSRRKNSQKGR